MDFFKNNICQLVIIAILALVLIRIDDLLIKIDTVADENTTHYGALAELDDVPE